MSEAAALAKSARYQGALEALEIAQIHAGTAQVETEAARLEISLLKAWLYSLGGLPL